MSTPPPFADNWQTLAGDWFTAINWLISNPNVSPTPYPQVPDADSAAYIGNNTSVTFTVTYNGTDEIWSFGGNGNVIVNMTGGSLQVDHNSFTYDEFDVHTGASLLAASGATMTFSAGVISGTLGGAGTIGFAGGAFSLNAGTVLSAAGLTFGVNGDGFGSTTTFNTDLTYAGKFLLDDYSGNNAVIALNSHTFTLTGDVLLGGTINGPGTLLVKTNTAQIAAIIGGGATVEIKGAVSQVDYSYSSTMSINGKLLIDAGSTYTILNKGGIVDNGATSGIDPAGQIVNNGTFVDNSTVAGTTRIYSHFTNNGTITVKAAETLYLVGVNTLGGTLNGSGTLVVGAGATTLNSTAVTVAGLSIDGGNAGATLTLGNDLSYGGAFTFANQFDTLALNSHTLTLSGSSNILSNSIQGAGTVKVTGAATVGFLSIGNGTSGTAATLTDAGSLTQTGYFSLNGTLQINAGATYTSKSTASISNNGATEGITAAAIIQNSGTFVDDSGGGVYTVFGHFTNGGTLTTNAGDTMVLAGINSLGGTINGAGTLVIGAGQTTLTTSAVTVAGLRLNGGNGGATLTLGTALSYGGVFAFDNQFDSLNLAGYAFTLSNANDVLSNTIVGAGSLTVTGTATFGYATIGTSGGTPTTIIDAGTMSQTGYVSLAGTLQIKAGATYSFANAANISDYGATVINAGTLTDNASGTSNIQGTFTNTGTVAIGSGATLYFSGKETFGGTISGAGTLGIGSGSATLSPTTLSVANVYINGGNGGGTTSLGENLTYGGTFTFANQFGTLALAGYTLTLSSTSSFSGSLSGGGTLNLTGSSTIGYLSVSTASNAVAATITDSKSVTQNGYIALNGTLQIKAGATYSFANAADISDYGAIVTNAGTLTDNAAGRSNISGTFTNTGTVSIGSGATLYFGGTETFGGTISGSGTLGIGGGSATLSPTTLSVAFVYINGGNGGGTTTLGADLTYGGNFTFANQFGTLALAGHTLTLGGASSFSGSMTGGGTLKLGGTSTIAYFSVSTGSGQTAATIEDSGTVTQGGDLALNGTLTIDASANYQITTASSINNNGATITNAGTLTDSAAGTSTINGAFTNTGTVSIASGATLRFSGTQTFGGTVSGTGTLAIGSGSALLGPGTLSVAAVDMFGGSATSIGADLTYNGTFDNEYGALALAGHALTLGGTTTFFGGSVDTGAGTLKITGNATLGYVGIGQASGSGTFVLGGAGTTTIGAGTTITTSAFTIGKVGTVVNLAENLTYAGTFSDTNATTLNLGANTLTLNGPALFNLGPAGSPQIIGTGKLLLGAATTLGAFTLGGSVLMRNNGTVTQTGTITLGTASGGAAQLTNAPGKSWTIQGDVGVVAGNATALFNNGGGTLSKASGTGTSAFGANFVNLAGTAANISIASGTLNFTGASNNFVADTISGAGTFSIGGGGVSTIGSGTTVTTSAWAIGKVGTKVVLGTNLTYGGSFGDTNQTVLDLGANTLTLTGATAFALGAAGAPIVTGTGKLILNGSSSTIGGLAIGGSTLLRDNGTVSQTGTVTLGDSTNGAALLTVGSGGVWQIAADVGIAAGSTGALVNVGGGYIAKTAGSGTSLIAPGIENLSTSAGTIRAKVGTLELGGALTGSLSLVVNGGATLQLDKAASAGTAASFVGSGGTLQFNDAQDFKGTIAGFGAGETLDLRSIGYASPGTTLTYSPGNNNAGTLTVSDGSHTAALSMLGSYSQGNFKVASDSHGGTAVTFV